MKKIKNLVVAQGKYMSDGQEKTRWLTIGSMFKKDDGNITLKLDSVPVGEFDGWVNVFDLPDRDAPQRAPAPSTAPQSYQTSVADEDVPF